jgi:hypothetical protein
MDTPYKGLVPYAEADADYFFGRDTDIRVISSNLCASRLTLLYGESGVGKSSLLNAGVAHYLRKEGDYAVVVFDSWQQHPAEGLQYAIADQVPELGRILHEMPYPSLAQAMRKWVGDLDVDNWRTLLIILDQFEDFFQYRPHNSSSHGDYGLADIIAAEDLPVHFLISIREDSLAGLDRFKSSVPGLFNNYLRVEHLSIAGAKDAILKPLRRFKEVHPGKAIDMADEKLADMVVQQIIEAQDDRSERVQAASLQLVMARWWEKETEKKSKKMRKKTLMELGKAGNIVAVHLDETLQKLSKQDVRNTEICFHVFDRLVTSTGRRNVQTLKELTDHTTYGNKKVRGLLGSLRAARIITPVPPPKGARPNELSFEFAHDLAAKAAAQWLEKRKRESAEREDTIVRANAELIEGLKRVVREQTFEKSAVLGLPRGGREWPEIFVLMPFTAELRPVYEHIMMLASKLSLRIGRADDFFGTSSILKDIWSAIHGARVVVADCTGRNPNVFYEIGLAHAIGRHTILISQSFDDVPFDLRHLQIIEYKYTPPGMEAFEKAFEKVLRESLARKP